MDYCTYLSSLFEDGRIKVPPLGPLTEDELRAGDEAISTFEQHYRLEIPGEAPVFLPAAGRWAGTRFYRACQFAVYRDVGEESVNLELGQPWEGARSPDEHYSVDLVFRYLPDLLRFAASAAARDPLVDHLRRWARQWPLSSLGVPDVGEVEINGFADHAALLSLYADRVIATNDVSRLKDQRVQEAVRSVLGAYPDLASPISAALETCCQQGENK